MSKGFLPISKDEMDKRGWKDLDVILVTGDAYVDHPSYGTAEIGRVLENAGFRVGIIAQPDWKRTDDFKRLGRPRLFFGVTAGNLESMVANYTANRHRRKKDDYSPGGKAGLRPDRATIIYTNKIREAFDDAIVVLGGIEASMRRLAHYDYWTDRVRRSVLLDSKADILVYGMGEKAVLEIANRLKRGEGRAGLNNIRGTVIVQNRDVDLKDCVRLPTFDQTSSDRNKFGEAFRTIYAESEPINGKTLIQPHGDRFVVQFPPPSPLTTEEMDGIYSLGYMRRWHPVYDKDPGVPGFETVRYSVISHRGCPGGCSFCSLYLHQGGIVQSRSERSILSEIETIAGDKEFRGTITDIGGPTANLYKADCRLWKNRGVCRDRKCLMPEKCQNLRLGYEETMRLWKAACRIKGVRHIFIGSGFRYDLLTGKYSDLYLKTLCAGHVSGRLKVAPEHCDDSVLQLMNKPEFGVYKKFVKRFNAANRELGKEQYLVNYFICGHPGAGLEEALKTALALRAEDIHPEQVQDFIPLPMTASGCMYFTETDPFSGKRIYVPKGLRERKLQRALIQYNQPRNRKYVIEALRKLNKLNMADRLLR